MGLSYFWFIAAAVIGAMDLYFGNFFLLVISAAAFTTALFSFFLSSVYLQVAMREVDFYSEILRRHIGKTVTVHEWRHNRYATVQYNGRVWEAEIAFNAGGNLRAGKYKIWKMLSNRLVLIP